MFEIKESKKIDLLNVNAQIYQHSEFNTQHIHLDAQNDDCLLYTSPSPRD